MRNEIGAQGSARVVVNGVRLAYDDRGGTGPVLLCLHALGHGARDFAPLRERLGGRYRVIALDWPGQGASDSEAAPPTSAGYAEHLEAFCARLGLESCVLLGNSIGGAAAIEFAVRHPERVRALIVANPGGLFMRRFGATLVVRVVAAFFAAGAAGARWFPALFASLYRRLLRGEHAQAQRERIVSAGRELAPLLAAGWRAFAEPASDLRELAKRVTAPVLVVWSTGDPLNRLAFNRAGIRNFPDARLETFDGGHAPFLETPDAFLRVFDAFTAEIAHQQPSHSVA
jgi:pimeloyl-ACP methyl ester carboxylesterase